MPAMANRKMDLNSGDHQTIWTPEMVKDLQICRDRARSRHTSLNEAGVAGSFQQLLAEEWCKIRPQCVLNVKTLKARLYLLEHPRKDRCGKNHAIDKKTRSSARSDPSGKEPPTKWTNEMLDDLQSCRDRARSRHSVLKRTGKRSSFQDLLADEWRKLHPQCPHTPNNLTTRLYTLEHSKEMVGGSGIRKRLMDADHSPTLIASPESKKDDIETLANRRQASSSPPNAVVTVTPPSPTKSGECDQSGVETGTTGSLVESSKSTPKKFRSTASGSRLTAGMVTPFGQNLQTSAKPSLDRLDSDCLSSEGNRRPTLAPSPNDPPSSSTDVEPKPADTLASAPVSEWNSKVTKKPVANRRKTQIDRNKNGSANVKAEDAATAAATEDRKTTWTGRMLSDLVRCRDRAKARQAALRQTGVRVSYQSILVESWKRLYPEYTHDRALLVARLYHLEHPRQRREAIGDAGSDAPREPARRQHHGGVPSVPMVAAPASQRSATTTSAAATTTTATTTTTTTTTTTATTTTSGATIGSTTTNTGTGTATTATTPVQTHRKLGVTGCKPASPRPPPSAAAAPVPAAATPPAHAPAKPARMTPHERSMNSEISRKDLGYKALKAPTKVASVWTPEMLQELQGCRDRACLKYTNCKAGGDKTAFHSLLLDEWKALYPYSKHDSGNDLAARLGAYEHKADGMTTRNKKKSLASSLSNESETLPSVLEARPESATCATANASFAKGMRSRSEELAKWRPITGIALSPSKGLPDIHVKLKDVNPLLTCGLCRGYLIGATTITDCLHSFCKSCIVRHVGTVSVNCPTCGNIIHPSNPYQSMRLDCTIQDIVYKLLPHLEVEEKRREKEFYISRGLQYPPPKCHVELAPPPAKRKKPRASASRSASPAPVEYVSIHLEHAGSAKGTGALRVLTKNYIRVTSLATVGHLQRLLDNKLNANHLGQLSLFVDSYLLHSSLTLHDVKELFFEDNEELMTIQYGIMPLRDFFDMDTKIVESSSEEETDDEDDMLDMMNDDVIELSS